MEFVAIGTSVVLPNSYHFHSKFSVLVHFHGIVIPMGFPVALVILFPLLSLLGVCKHYGAERQSGGLSDEILSDRATYTCLNSTRSICRLVAQQIHDKSN